MYPIGVYTRLSIRVAVHSSLRSTTGGVDGLRTVGTHGGIFHRLCHHRWTGHHHLPDVVHVPEDQVHSRRRKVLTSLSMRIGGKFKCTIRP